MPEFKITNRRFPHLIEYVNEVELEKMKHSGVIGAYKIESVDPAPEPKEVKEVKEAKAEKKTKSKDD